MSSSSLCLMQHELKSVFFYRDKTSDGIRPVRTVSQEPVLRISVIPRTGCWFQSGILKLKHFPYNYILIVIKHILSGQCLQVKPNDFPC